MSKPARPTPASPMEVITLRVPAEDKARLDRLARKTKMKASDWHRQWFLTGLAEAARAKLLAAGLVLGLGAAACGCEANNPLFGMDDGGEVQGEDGGDGGGESGDLGRLTAHGPDLGGGGGVDLGQVVPLCRQPRHNCAEHLAIGCDTDGVYPIHAHGKDFNVYCDMTTDGGGWTLVVGISAYDRNHGARGDVASDALVDPASKGKFADAVINDLRSQADPAFRLRCGAVTGYWPASCTFAANQTATGDCTAEAYGYPVKSYGLGQQSQDRADGLADGDSGTTERLIYATSADHDDEATGCDTAIGPRWRNAGTLWVR